MSAPLTHPDLRWPAGLHPREVPVHSVNEVRCVSPPAALWPHLVRADTWREWYSNARGMRFLDCAGPELHAGCRFSWITFGVRVETEVIEFEPPSRLTWVGTGLGARGCHTWLLLEEGGGTRAITEETQIGAVPSLCRWAFRPLLHHFHQRWLEGLAARAGGAARSDPS